MDEEWSGGLDRLAAARAAAVGLGGEAARERLRRRGKWTARERLAALLDPGSFHELGMLAEGRVVDLDGAETTVPTDAMVGGWGEIDGRTVFAVADDGRVMGGAGSTLNVEKRFRIRQMAIAQGRPFVGLYEGSAIRFQDSMDAGRMARIPAFREVVECAGVVPTAAAVMGPGFGRPPMDVLYADFSVQIEGTGFLGLSGPALVAGGIGEATDAETLAGTAMHVDATGLVDRAAPDEASGLALVRAVLAYLPPSCHAAPPRIGAGGDPDRPCPELTELVPSNPRRPYDMGRVVERVVDPGTTFPYKPTFGRSVITCLARIDGHPVGVVASQPAVKGGVLDADACLKVRRLVAVCDAFHVPLVFLQDQPGFMIGTRAERERILYWAGTLLGAMQRATVPKITVILRKSHGAALWAMGGQNVGGDLVVAWPLAIMTGTGPASAVNTIHARELAASDDPRRLRAELEARYARTGSAFRAAATFGIDDVIEPAETRRFLAAALALGRQRRAGRLGRRERLFP